MGLLDHVETGTPTPAERPPEDRTQEARAATVDPQSTAHDPPNAVPPGAIVTGIGHGGRPVVRDAKTMRMVKGSAALAGAGKPQALGKIVRDIVHFPGLVSFLQDVAIGKLAAGTRMADRIKAAEILLDRGYGKPQVHVELKDDTSANAREKVKGITTEQLEATVDNLRALIDGKADKGRMPEPVDAEIVEAGNALGASHVVGGEVSR